MEKSRFDYVVFDIETTGLNPKSDRICEHESAGCYGDAESARKQRQRELEALDHQYRDGEPMTGCGIALQ